jgi:hypothetical protein
MGKIFSFKIFLVILFINYGLNANADTYYVSTDGNDNNPGSQTQPWAHCPGMPNWGGSGKLSAGDIVYFDSADTWTVLSGNYVIDITGGVTYIGDTWGNGTKAKLVAGATLNQNAVVRWVDDDPTYETVLQGFEIDGGGGQSACGYTSSTRGTCPRSGSCYRNDGISMGQTGLSQNLTGATKRVDNCLVHSTYSCQSSGEYNYGIILRSISTYWVDDVEIINTVVYDQSRGCYNLYPYEDSPDNLLSNVIVRGCECYNSGVDPSYGSGNGLMVKNEVSTATLEFNYIHDIQGTTGNCAIINTDETLTNGPQGIVLRYNIFENCNADGVHIRSEEPGSGGTISGEIYGNIIHANSGTNAIKLDGGVEGTVSYLKIYNNTIYDEGITIESNSATINTLEVKNNIINSTSSYIPLTDVDGDIIAHNNNIYYREGGGTLVSAPGGPYTSANLSSYENTALSSDPQLNNVSNFPTGFTGTYGVDMKPNTEGFNINSNSYAKNTADGTLGYPYNRSINSVIRPSGEGWDRGAYEFNGFETEPPAAPTGLRVLPLE